MLNLVFAEPGPGPVVHRGPYREVRADAHYLRAPDGSEIARHADHCWYVGASKFFRIDCRGPVMVRFENPDGTSSGVVGPIFHFSSADGIAYGDGEILGHVDVDRALWYSTLGDRYWKEIVVMPAG